MRKMAVLCLLVLSSCATKNAKEKEAPEVKITQYESQKVVALPAPDVKHDVRKYSEVIGWGEQKPLAPKGFSVAKYQGGFQNPRWIYVGPNGDVFVAEAASLFKNSKDRKEAITSGKIKSQNLGKSANRITVLRDTDGDGVPDVRKEFLKDLKQPLGMLILKGYFYVANTDGVWRYKYEQGQLEVRTQGEKILTLPAGGYNNHWTRNLIANKDGSKIYISVGSASNVGEHGMAEEKRRANILEISPDGSGERIFAAGLRNPVGMGWAPGTSTLWTAVNERDNLGDDLVPDYMTSVQDGGFYGWPYAYFGKNEDPRMAGKRPDLVSKTLVPDIALGSHTASLGLALYDKKSFPSRFQGGAFIGQHGSWNRSEISGYKVVFVPFKNGQPAGRPEDFLTGFVSEKESAKVFGCPVGVTVTLEGHLLVADDASNTIWIVKAI